MIETRGWELSDYPLVCDPAAQALEARCRSDDEPEEGGWRQLVRVPIRHDSLPFTLGGRAVHYFGLSSEVSRCPFLLVYDATGVLRYHIVWDGREREFVPVVVPEEVSGQPVPQPSVRLSFAEQEQAVRFAGAVHQLRQLPAARSSWEERRRLLSEVDELVKVLVCPPRLTAVALTGQEGP